MKTIITVKTDKGILTNKKEYKHALDELYCLIDKIDWALKDKVKIDLIPLKDGARMIAE